MFLTLFDWKEGFEVRMAKVTEVVQALAQPIVEENGCTLWDVEYVKEAGVWYLRLYIDKAGGVSIDDCVAIDHAMDPVLDAADPIPGSYTFEVSSAGADRALKKPEHFAACLGSEVEVKLYRAEEGRKEWVGTLTAYADGDVSISAPAGEKTFLKKDIAQVRLYVRV
ncbi:ribosome maturation factor RimP [Oscillospiraceae bacterium]|nr:ribosome maturation factor RimP [Oscillospiraceae bacterium]